MIEFEISTNKKQIDFDITQGIPKYTPANFQSKTVIPTTEQQIIRADIPYDGLEQVTVEPIKVLDKTITQNGAYSANEENIDGYSSVFVNVQPNLQEKSITITENGTTEVVADSGYDGLAKVSVEANVVDNSLLNVIKGMNSYDKDTPEYHFELTADMFDENSTYIPGSKYYSNNNIISAYIPNNITGIGATSFSSCKGLKRVHIPDSVTDMGSSAFSGCSNLEIVDISDIASWCNISFNGGEANPLVNRSKLYLNGELVTDLVIPEGVTKIPQTAFSRCNSIKTITLPNTLTSIGASSFSYSYITNITIPDSVTSMDGSSFYGASLESVTIGNGLTKTGNSSFYYCNKLKSVTFGSNIANLGSNLFQNCYSLAIVDFRSATQVPTVQSNSFNYVPTTCKFIIPDDLYDSWITATNWASLYAKGYQFVKASEYVEA